MPAKVDIELVLGSESGTGLAARLPSTSAPQLAANVLASLLLECASGQRRGRLRVQVDESTGVKATGTVACTQASATAGDLLHIGDVFLTAVAGAADASAGQYSIDTGDTEMAASIAAAINGYAPLKGVATATSSTGTVTITVYQPGSVGNGILVRKTVTTAGALTITAMSGGTDPGGKRSRTVTMAGVFTDADTVAIGGVTLTAKNSPSGESQFAVGASATAAAANLATAINAHSKLKGLVSASAASGVCTITLLVGGRIGELISLTKSAANATLSAAHFGPATTEVWSSSYAEYNLGAL